jgi:hypothetical protein
MTIPARSGRVRTIMGEDAAYHDVSNHQSRQIRSNWRTASRVLKNMTVTLTGGTFAANSTLTIRRRRV